MPDVLLGLGSNAEAHDNLKRCIELLAALGSIRCVSRVYESPDITGAGPSYYNAAVLLSTELELPRLRLETKRIEKVMGRTADGEIIPIDIDICFYDRLIGEYDGYSVPHPGTLRHGHVTVPAADCAPDFLHPVTGETLQQIASRTGAGVTPAAPFAP